MYYCSKECQKAHWRQEHRVICQQVAAAEARNAANRGQLTPEELEQILQGGYNELVDVQPDGGQECAICLKQPMAPPIVQLPRCGHVFCARCILAFQTSRGEQGILNATDLSMSAGEHVQQAKENTPCPLCRQATGEDLASTRWKRAQMLASEANIRKDLSSSDASTLRKHAIRLLDQLLDTPKPSLQVHFTKAELLHELGRHREAAELLQGMLDENEHRLKHPVLPLVEEDHIEGEPCIESMALAIEAAEQYGLPADRLESKFVTTVALGECWMEAGEFQKALDAFRSAVDDLVDPNQHVASQRKVWAGVARCHYELGNDEKAIDAADAAIYMNRYYGVVYRYRALALQRQRRLDEAIETANKGAIYQHSNSKEFDNEMQQTLCDLYVELTSEKVRGNGV